MKRETIFSPDRLYRYTLWREWDCDLLTGTADDIPHATEYLMVIGLNPSTADETKDDPTIRRCKDFAVRWGFGALCMTNLFAWRDTKPENMKAAKEPVGQLNDVTLINLAQEAGMVLAAWGKHGSHLDRARALTNSMSSLKVKLHALRLNRDGSPQHPLYIPADTQPIAFNFELTCKNK